VSDLRPVEPLDPKRHQINEFRCGQPSLDRWLHAYAGQSQRRDVARTFVASEPNQRVVAYYSLVAGQAEHAAAPAAVTRGISRHFPIPICLIARLAVDQRWQGRGLGSAVLRGPDAPATDPPRQRLGFEGSTNIGPRLPSRFRVGAGVREALSRRTQTERPIGKAGR
jgi:GNAT superfamily N-acetyltransferase